MHCPLRLLLFHCYYLFMDFLCKLPVFRTFPSPLPTDLPDFSFGVASCHLPTMVSRTHSKSTVLLSLEPKEKLFLLLQNAVLIIGLNPGLLKVFSLSQSKLGRFGLLAKDCQLEMTSSTNIQPQKKKSGIINTILTDEGERRHGWWSDSSQFVKNSGTGEDGESYCVAALNWDTKLQERFKNHANCMEWHASSSSYSSFE